MNQIPSQIISLEGEKYAILQENLKEFVRIPAADVKNRIDKVGNIPVVRLRQNFLPLLNLADVLSVQKTYLTATGEKENTRREQIADRRSIQHLNIDTPSDLTDKETLTGRQKNDRRTNPVSAVNIAIVSSEGYKYGLIVDRLHDSEEIEVCSSGRYIGLCGVYLGTTTLKNKRAVLVLDIYNIAHTSGLSKIAETINDSVSDIIDDDPNLKHFSLLTFRNSENEHFAVDLDTVDRLERFKNHDFEKIGTEEVIQYRGSALPLFELSKILKCNEFTDSENQEVIVFKHNGVLAGLKVLPPVDTVERRLAVDRSIFNTPSVLGSAVISDKTTLLLDVPAMVKAVQGDHK